MDLGKQARLRSSPLLRFENAVVRDPAIDAWLKKQKGELEGNGEGVVCRDAQLRRRSPRGLA
jgi:hypothetical protein